MKQVQDLSSQTMDDISHRVQSLYFQMYDYNIVLSDFFDYFVHEVGLRKFLDYVHEDFQDDEVYPDLTYDHFSFAQIDGEWLSRTKKQIGDHPFLLAIEEQFNLVYEKEGIKGYEPPSDYE